MDKVYYSPSYKGIITLPHPTNPNVSAYGTKINDLLLEYPDMILISFDKATDLQDAAYRTKPALTTEDRFNDMLDCLPPQNWKNINGGCYFQMCEFLAGNITAYFACKNNAYYTWNDTAWLKPQQVEEILSQIIIKGE
jgi:hypothetical protein